MEKVYDRRFLGMFGFLGFLGFSLGFLGPENYQHLVRFAWISSFATLASLVFTARNKSKVSARYQLKSMKEVFEAIAGRK